jgi:hypothetical protein
MTQDEPSPEDHWEQNREELRWLARLGKRLANAGGRTVTIWDATPLPEKP